MTDLQLFHQQIKNFVNNNLSLFGGLYENYINHPKQKTTLGSLINQLCKMAFTSIEQRNSFQIFISNLEKSIKYNIAQMTRVIDRHPRDPLRRLELKKNINYKLYHYRPMCSKSHRKKTSSPLLIVFSLINKPDILDLNQSTSFIQKLLNDGNDIYLIDWEEQNHRNTSFSEYIVQHLNQAIDFLRTKLQFEKINLAGICQGGVFSLCYSTLFPEKIQNLILISTPVDFHTENNLLSNFVRCIDMGFIKKMPEINGTLLVFAFIFINPYFWLKKKYSQWLQALNNEKSMRHFAAMEKWAWDVPNLGTKFFVDFIRNFYQKNYLVQNKIKIAGKTIDLKNLTMPVLNIYAKNDQLVPVQASKALKKYVDKKNYSEFELQGGHIGIYVKEKSASQLSSIITNLILQNAKQGSRYGKKPREKNI